MIERFAITEPIVISALLLGCAVIIFYARVEIAAGIYCSAMFWAYNVDVGPVTFLWVLVGTLLASALVHIVRRRIFRLTLAERQFSVWLCLWFLWTIMVYIENRTTLADLLMKNILLYNVLAFAIIFLFINDVGMMRRFAYAFIATSLIAGVASLQFIPELLDAALRHPSFHLRGLTGINYLTFGTLFALSTIFSLAMILARRNKIEALAMSLIAPICAVFLVLTGARQSLLAATIASIILIVWFIRTRRIRHGLIVLAIVAIVVIVVVLYSSTALWERWTPLQLQLALGSRQDLWRFGWDMFTRSPIWGNGLDYSTPEFGTAHNLILDSLASQGIIGFVFLCGLILFTLRVARGSWSADGSSELAKWRAALLAIWVAVFVQTQISGSVAGSWHFFWLSALIWRLAMMARQNNSQPSIVVRPAVDAPKIRPSNSGQDISL